MKKIVRILLAILMVMCLALSITACKSECDKGNHSWDEGTVTKAATCTTKGVKTYKCTACDQTRDEDIAALGHDYTNVKWVPSATDANKHERACTRCDYKETASHTTGAATCPDCGKDLGGSVIPCTHPDKTFTTDAATCTTAEVKHWTCPDCDWTDDETVGEPLGHLVTTWTPSETEGKHEGTCTREGCDVKVTEGHTPNEAGTECTKCHASLGGTVEPCTHPNKTYTTQDATCTTAEIKHWTCPDCDWTDDETVGEPLDHDYTGRTWAATTDGSKHQMTCTRCDYVKTEEHNPVKVDGFAASCMAAGKEDGSKCSDCNHVISVGAEIPAIPHNYEGQAWKTASGKHYQECAYGCGTRNEHNSAMGTYKKVGDNHVSTCTVSGCTIKSEHAPDFGDWTITETSHYKQCTHTGCTYKTEVGDHNQDALENKNTTQHTVACSACGKTYPDANHVWGEFAETKAPTCTVVGIKTRTCACGATDTDTIDMIDHTESYENTEDERIVTCSVCGTELDRIEHVFEWYDGDRQEHYKKCETCDYILESTRAGHNYPDEFVCSVCGRIPEDVIVSVYYNGVYTSKDTLADAIAFVTDNTAATIYLGESLEGAGIVIPADRNITLRLLGNTYTVTSPVSDTTQGIVLSKGSTVRILNGTITTAENSGVTTLVANYANLTLTNVKLYGTNLDAVSDGHNYTLRSYFGTTSMTSSLITARTATEYALDVLYGTADEYMDGVSVTVGASSVINGYVRYGSQAANTDWSNVVLRLRSTPNYIIHFSCDVDCDTVNIKKVNTSTGEEAQLAHRKDQDWTHDETAGSHYHLCTRCGAHTDEASCELTKKTVAGTPATCTKSGLTDGQKCSVCGTTLVARTTIPALGHNYDESIEGHVTINKDATCTEDGTKTVQCSRCAVTEERTIDALGHNLVKESETAATCTTAQIDHYKCSRCDYTENRTVGEALGHNLVKESETAATCTTAQINHMSCSRCDYTEDQTEGSALGHDWATAWTAVDALQHAHLCQRAGCDATNGATSHTYTANHCDACGKDITQDEIIALMADLDENGDDGDWLVSSDSTFVLTGIYDGQSAYKDNYKLVDDEGNLIVICYKLDVSDLVVGDKITVTGNIKKYKTTIEFDQGCTYTVVRRGDVTITWTKGEDVTVEGLVNKVERLSTVEFSVPHSDDYNVIVKVNGTEIQANSEGKYSFEAKADTTVEIELKNANITHPHIVSNSTDATVKNDNTITATAYASAQTGSCIIDGVTFEYRTIITDNNKEKLQLNTTNNKNTDNPNAYMKVIVPNGYITSFVLADASNKDKLIITGIGEDGSETTLTIDTTTGVVDVTGKQLKAIKFTSSGATALTEIKVTYGETYTCSNTENFTHHDENAPTCTEDGNIEYWTCDVCNKKFSDALCNTAITSVVDEAHKATGHSLTKVERQNATCTEAGHVEHWICSVEGCGAKFSDENGTTPIDDVTIPANGHSYGDWTNIAGTATHKHTCSVEGCGAEETENCASETWLNNAANHWKVCDKCDATFGEAPHSGDTACECGALKLTYKVYNANYFGQDDKEEVANHDVTVTMQTYAAVGDTIKVTPASQKYSIELIASGENTFNESAGVYTGVVAEGGIIEIYVESLSSAKYAGATINGLKEEGDISVTATVDGTALKKGDALAKDKVITIEIMYAPTDYEIAVVVTQGSSINTITLGDYDEEAMAATGTYTCQAMGDVTITVNARAKYTVTIPTIENVTLTVKKVVEGGDEAVNNGDTVYVDDIIKVEATPATNYQVNSITVNGTETVTGGYKVTGDVTIEVELAKKVTVNLSAVENGTLEVTYGSGDDVTTVADGDKVDVGTKLTITVTPDDGYKVKTVTVTGDAKPLEPDDNGKYTYDISNGITGNSITISAETELIPETPKPITVTFNSNSGTSDSTNAFTTSTTVTEVIASGADNISGIKATNNVYLGKAGYGIKFSSSSKTGSIEFTLKTELKGVTKIIVNAATWGSDSNTGIKVNNLNSQSLTTSFADYTFKFDEATDITTIKLDAVTKRIYVKSVTICFD